jgi:amino acid permease
MAAAIKILIIVVFIGLMFIIILSIMNGRRNRRREAEDF